MKYFIIFFFSLLVLQGNAQILDDSTKQIYGTHSTFYQYEEDVMNIDSNQRSLDTSFHEFHTGLSSFRERNFVQDLGNFATPLNPVNYEHPTFIGRQFGFSSMDSYVFDPAKIKLFDTRSPFTQLTYLQGTKGQQMLEAEFSRHIKPNWNFGFDIRRMASKRQIGFPERNAPQVTNTAFQFNTRYFTKDKRYSVIAIYSIFEQNNIETGGVLPDEDDTVDSLYEQNIEKINFTKTARSDDRRVFYHLYQHYDFTGTGKLQVYVVGDYQTRIMRYKDNDIGDHPAYYPDTVYDDTTTIERNTFKTAQGSAGVKGRAGKLNWRGYYQFRYMEYAQYYHDTIRTYTEQYVGGVLRYTLHDSSYAEANAQVLLAGAYQFNGKLKLPFVTLSAGSMSYLPSVVQEVYYGNNYQWKNDFKNISQQYLRAELSYKTKAFDITPFGGLDHISNYVYYDSVATPRQDSSSSWVYHAGITMNVRWKGFAIRETVRWNSVSGNTEVFRLPQWYNHLRLSYAGQVFKHAALIHVGVDVFYKSAYQAYGWSPGMMNYRQSDINDPFSSLPSALVSNLFIDLSLKQQFTFFLRFTFLNQGFPSNGYYLTPLYPSLPRTMDFGIRWRFYD